MDDRALEEIRGIALRRYHEARKPDVMVLHIEALRDWMVRKGIEPGFDVKVKEKGISWIS